MSVKAKGPFYKILRSGRMATHMHNFRWPVPGKYTIPVQGRLAFCKNGYHILTRKQLENGIWLPQHRHRRGSGNNANVDVWLVKVEGEVRTDGNKCICRSAKLVHKVGRWDLKKIRALSDYRWSKGRVCTVWSVLTGRVR
jgi:hypothetical protein